MICPFCQHPQSKVVDSRVTGDAIRRRRECEGCEKRYTTHERVEWRMPQVVKKSGGRQAFDRAKVRGGFQLACRKRPVSPDAIELAIDAIEARVRRSAEREIPSITIGAMVLEELLKLDRVAYLRFASVYQEFATPEEFLELLQPLLSKP